MSTQTHSVNLGKIGFNTRLWSSSTSYTKNDFVVYENSLYTATTSVPAGTLPTNTNYFMCVSKGVTPKGAYNSNDTYAINDIVIYNNNAYWCMQDNVTALPTDTTYWMQIPSPSLNAGFGIGNRYSVVPADSDLEALWNLVPNGTVDGSEELYGMTALTNNYRPVLMAVEPAPYHETTTNYRLSTGSDGQKSNNSGRHVNIPSIVFDTVGTVKTFRFLVYASSSYSYNYLRFLAPSWVESDYPDNNTYGLQFGFSGSYLWCGLTSRSSTRDFFYSSSSESNADFRYMVIPDNINEFVFVIERTASGYNYDSYVNGAKFRSGSSTYNYNATITGVYLGTAGSSSQTAYNRGIAQVEIYNGAKITAPYTPSYQLLSEPSI